MALTKSTQSINFSKGLETKTDPFQIQVGNFLSLENTIFSKAGLLQKRNGYGDLTALPDASATYLTTFSGNLTAIGTSVEAFSSGSGTWVTKGAINIVDLNTLALIRSSTNQTYADTVVASNGLVCTVFTDNIPDGSGGSNPVYKYAIADSVTGQNIVAPTIITSTGTITYAPRVFLLGKYFMILFDTVITATNHLQYIAINITTPTIMTAATDISTQYTPASTGSFDAFMSNNKLYVAWNGSDGGGAIRIRSITQALVQATPVVFTGHVATHMSVTADETGSTPTVYVSFYDSASKNGYTLAVDQNLNTVMAPQQIINNLTVLNITGAAQNGVLTVFYEIVNSYSYDSAIRTDYVVKILVTPANVTPVGAPTILARSVGLASKAFIMDGVVYVLTIYSSPFQPTYFLLDSTGRVISKLAYSNGGQYYITGLPSVTVIGENAFISYLIKDLIQAVNKTPGAAALAAPAVYSQLGVNLVDFTFGPDNIISSEIGKDLHLSGGFMWMYDGYLPVEHLFHLWPDSVEATWSATGGHIAAKPDGATNINAYFYYVTYEWSDNQGNMFRSAPSIPVGVTTTGSGVIGSITVNVPTLRLTYKISNPVKIVIYRSSVAQGTPYQVTSIQIPIINNTTVDSITYIDTLADASIIGNNILYTTGGVIENIAAPATSTMTLFKSRLVLLDSEDRNLLWFSKQVIETTPVETSDLFTIFVAPTVGSQGDTGVIKCLSAMDDKLIIFKENALYYITGNGPDNTGANNDFSEPVFITATVGCANQKSIVFMPQGLMFQSDKGIWLLARDLSTNYIGAPVEAFNQFAVQSAVNVPGTNQVRFTLSNGVTLMYDYYFGQWGTFVNVPAISSTLYQGLHTYLNKFGLVFQETPSLYLDGSKPVLMSFTTGWMNLAGLQGFERAYFFYLLGTYITPHKIGIQIAYDYAPTPSQGVTIPPDNFSPVYGADPIYGNGSPYGGSPSLEQWKVYFDQQKCQAFQLIMQESYDATFGVPAGAGFTLSGLTLIVGAKKGYPTLPAARSTG